MSETVQKSFWSRLKIRHRRNKKKGLYDYMWKTALKIILIYLAIMVPAILISNYLLDFNAVFEFITTRFKDWFVLTVFFISEIFLGMIPPDFFVIWSSKFNSPLIYLTILGVLSYAGGAVAYYLGVLLLKRKKIKEYSERVLSKYINMIRKVGRCLYRYFRPVSILPILHGGYCSKPVQIPIQTISDLWPCPYRQVSHTGNFLHRNPGYRIDLRVNLLLQKNQLTFGPG